MLVCPSLVAASISGNFTDIKMIPDLFLSHCPELKSINAKPRSFQDGKTT